MNDILTTIVLTSFIVAIWVALIILVHNYYMINQENDILSDNRYKNVLKKLEQLDKKTKNEK